MFFELASLYRILLIPNGFPFIALNANKVFGSKSFRLEYNTQQLIITNYAVTMKNEKKNRKKIQRSSFRKLLIFFKMLSWVILIYILFCFEIKKK